MKLNQAGLVRFVPLFPQTHRKIGGKNLRRRRIPTIPDLIRPVFRPESGWVSFSLNQVRLGQFERKINLIRPVYTHKFYVTQSTKIACTKL